MTGERIVLIGLGVGAALLALTLLAAWLLRMRRKLQSRRPEWPRLLADVDYFRAALSDLFQAQGYRVTGHWLHQDPDDETPREVVFALEKAGRVYAALCVRWIVPVTSEVIGRFEHALATTRADAGLIVTTSIFTTGARERARGLPVQLYDRSHLEQWIAQAWP